MKTLFKSGLVLALGLLLYSNRAQAQVQINVQVPAWGPAVGPNVQYYYLPEIDGYYDLYTQSYLFFDPVYGAWISSPVLPRAYAGYDPRFFHPVVVQYVGRQPWGYLRDHRAYCDRWGVQPGRYYGSNWPGRGYVVAPRPNYGPGGYYDNRSYNQGGYARGDYRDYRDNRDYRGNYPGGYDGRYDGRRDDNRPSQSPGSYNGRPDNRGNYNRNDQGSISGPGNQGSQPGGTPPSPGSYSGGRGRGRGL